MGTLLGTTVFIELERAFRRMPASSAMRELGERLEEQLGSTEEVGIAAITASELLHGVHRAAPEHRPRRAAFVEGLLAAFPPLPFDLLAARAHARLWAETWPLRGTTQARTTGSSQPQPSQLDGVSRQQT